MSSGYGRQFLAIGREKNMAKASSSARAAGDGGYRCQRRGSDEGWHAQLGQGGQCRWHGRCWKMGGGKVGLRVGGYPVVRGGWWMG